MSRRYLIIGLAVIALIAVAVVAFFLFSRGTDPGVTPVDDPFGGAGSGDAPFGEAPSVLEEGTDFTNEAGTEVAPRLVRITDAPVARGVASIYIPEIPAATSTDGTVIPMVPPDVEVRFIERQTGNVYAYRAHERTLTRISNQTVPGIERASWLSDGSMAFVQFLSSDTGAERIESYALPASGEGGYFLEQDLAQVTATGTATVLTLRTSTTGAVATVARPDGSNPRTAFSSALSSIVVAFSGPSNYLATTKGSASADGFSFLINGTSGSTTRLLGPLRGIAAIPSSNGASVVYSYVNRGTLSTAVLDVASRTVVAFPVTTLAEKCVFSGATTVYCAVPKSLQGTLPDDWYQGVVSFSDRIWKIDLVARVAILLVDPSEVGQVDIDAVALSIDRTDDVLTFTNRIDGSLWAFDL